MGGRQSQIRKTNRRAARPALLTGVMLMLLALACGAALLASGTALAYRGGAYHDSEPDTFEITVTHGSHGEITPGTVHVTRGHDQTFTVTADAGYHIESLKIDDHEHDGAHGDASHSYKFTNVDKKHTIDATFAADPPVTYTITVTHGANGEITPGTGPVNRGSDPVYAITPAEGYHIESLTVDDVAKDVPVDGTWTFADVQETHSIAATFAPNVVDMTVTHGSHGEITCDLDPVVYDSSPIYTITPAEGYHIESLTVDDVAKDVPVDGTWTFADVQETHSIAATFAPNVVDMTVTHGSHGEITCDLDPVVYDSSPIYTITPAEGYHIESLTVDDVAKDVPVDGTWTFADVQETHSIAATFAPNVVDMTVTHGSHGEITCDLDPVVYDSSPIYTITPAEGYHIESLTVDDVAKDVPVDGTWTFADVQETHSIDATFAIDTFAITVTAGENGSITPGSGSVDWGSSPVYTITPAEGYHIESLTVDDVARTPQAGWTFMDVKESHAIAATFAVDALEITVTPGEHGSITSPTGSPVYGGDITFTITPDEGYHIESIVVDGVQQDLPDTSSWTFHDVTSPHSIAATFDINTYRIEATSEVHGSIDPGSITVEYGARPTFEVSPRVGYMVKEVLVDGVSVGAVLSYQFDSVKAPHTISASFRPDATDKPRTTVAGVLRRWSRVPETLTFTARPGVGGAPVTFTEYRLNGGDWVVGTQVTVAAEGTTLVEYRSHNSAGVIEAPWGKCSVRIDSRAPQAVARRLTARPNTIARLKYNVRDPKPGCGRAVIVATVLNEAGEVMTRSRALPWPTNAWRAVKVRTFGLTPGTYTIELRATDVAGNVQSSATHTTLTVR